MAIRDDLERALRVSWNPADLAVYGDHLQTLGDPRGELIALDLHPRPDDPAWQARRKALLATWLGEPAEWLGALVQHGFAPEVRAEQHPHTLLETPLGDFVRGYSSSWSNRGLAHLAQLAERPRPWLTRIAIYHEGTTTGADLRERVIAATPNLIELHVFGDQLFTSFAHPSLQRLYTSDRPPKTTAEIILVDDCPYVGRALSAGAEIIQPILAAVARTSDVNELYATCEGLVGPRDSLSAMLVRLSCAKLVELVGPIVHLTTTGRIVLHGPISRSVTRAPTADGILVVEDSSPRDDPDDTPGARLGAVAAMTELLARCLERIPIDDSVALESFVAFLATLGEKLVECPDLPAVVRALADLCALRELADDEFPMFDGIGDADTWVNLRRLSRFISWIERPVFCIVDD